LLFSVTIIGDKIAEPTETFTVVLSSPVNATIADDTGVVTILDDDPTTPVTSQATSGGGTIAFAASTASRASIVGVSLLDAWTLRPSAALTGSRLVAGLLRPLKLGIPLIAVRPRWRL
jgi:hypothetical protein